MKAIETMNAQRIRRTYEFLGPPVVSLLSWGVVAGLVLFGVELTFAYGIQAFLLALGVASASSVQLPQWVPTGNLTQVLGFFFVVASLRGLMRWLQASMQGAAQERFKYQQRSRLLEWLFVSESASSSQITTLFTERTNNAGYAVMHAQTALVQATSSLLVGCSLLWIAPGVTLIAGAVLLVLGIPVILLNKKIKAAGQGLAGEWTRTNDRMVMSIKNLLLLRIYDLARDEEKKARLSLDGYVGHALTYHRIAGFLVAAPQIFGVAVICLIALASKSWFVMAPGILVSYFYLFLRLLQDLSALAYTVSHFLFHLPQLKELNQWWSGEYRTPQTQASRARLTDASALKGMPAMKSAIGWDLSRVEFRYPGAQKSLFDGLNLEIAPGSAVAITGPSGVGKSTLLGLLLGQIAPEAGQVRAIVEGQSVQLQENLPGVLRNIGYVGAESFLVEGTVKQNLTYGLKHEPNLEEIRAAIEKADCGFVFDLPKGLDHFLTEQGQGLSAGQKQRLSLARALLRKPKALILDEATANLDLGTEARLVDTLMKLKGEVTVVAVTHREGMLRLAERSVELKPAN